MTDFFARPEELHVPDTRFLAVHLHLRGGLDLMLCTSVYASTHQQEIRIVYKLPNREHACQSAVIQTVSIQQLNKIFHSCVSYLRRILRVRDRSPFELGRSGRDQGASDHLPHPRACRHDCKNATVPVLSRFMPSRQGPTHARMTLTETTPIPEVLVLRIGKCVPSETGRNFFSSRTFLDHMKHSFFGQKLN